MSETAEKLKPVLAALSAEDREELMQYLMDLSGDPADDDWDPEYREEINRRIDDMRSGRDPGIPAEEVMKQMREKYG